MSTINLVYKDTVRGNTISTTETGKEMLPIIGGISFHLRKDIIAFSSVYDFMDHLIDNNSTIALINKSLTQYEYDSIIRILEKNELKMYGKNYKDPMYHLLGRVNITDNGWSAPLYRDNEVS